MAIAVDGSSPALVSGTGSTKTTASFSPPAGLLVACVAYEAVGSANATITLSNTGTGLTWTQRARRDANDSGTTFEGIAAVFTAVNTNAQTGITVSSLSAVGSDAGALKVLVFTGVDMASPVGATGEGSSGDPSGSPTVYTSTVAGSRAVGMFSDFSIQGTGSSSDTGYGFLVASRLGGVAVHKAADTPTIGTNVTLNFNNGSSFGQWNWAAIEIKPGAPYVAPPPRLLRQAVNRAATY